MRKLLEGCEVGRVPVGGANESKNAMVPASHTVNTEEHSVHLSVEVHFPDLDGIIIERT